MSILYRFLEVFNRIHPFENVDAHCDVPCGVYTTHQAGIAAETVEKMVQKLQGLGYPDPDAAEEGKLAWQNSATRMIQTKEEWAQICKQELLILWTDYFKEEHLQQFPDLHTTFWKAAKLCSQNKREVNLEAAQALRKIVDEIAKMFKRAEVGKAVMKRQEWL